MVPVETCLQRVKLVSLTYVPVGASLRRLKLVGFIYVPVRRRGDSWSVSLRYQFIRRYDVSNWLVLSTYNWDVGKTSQIGPPQSRTSCDVIMMSQHGPRRLNLYETQMRRHCDASCQVGSFLKENGPASCNFIGKRLKQKYTIWNIN